MEVLVEVKVVCHMRYDQPTDELKELVQLETADSELQSQSSTDALRQVARGALEPNTPEGPWTISTSRKAMAASAPGSEYWLP